MTSEGKFWVTVWLITALTVSVIAGSITGYWMDHNAKILEMVNNGVDPVAAMCAMQDDYGTMPVCVVLATKGTTK